jgi:hypothetical protein
MWTGTGGWVLWKRGGTFFFHMWGEGGDGGFLTELLAAKFSRRALIHGGTYS